MKIIERIIIIVILFTVIIGTYSVEFYGKYVVPIVMYHNIEEKSDVEHLNGVGVFNFDRQMSFLKKHNYNVISLDQLVSAITKQEALAHNTVVLTFDDGYEDNYLRAFPILKKYGFPAIIFIIPEAIGTEGYLTWEQIKEMEEFGVSIGSHTLNGAYLPDLSESDQIKEIRNSKKFIERKLNHPIYNLCYPSGGFSDSVKEIVKKFGYKAACTTNRGYDRFNRDVYELNRIRFGDKDKSGVVIWGKLSGYYNLFRKSVNPY